MKKIVRGNDFTLRVPVMKIVDGTKVAFPLPGCTDIKVNIVNQYRRVALGYTIDVSEDNVLLARVEGDKVSIGTYALEVKGKLFGNDWRSNEYEQFQLVDNNAAGDTAFEPQEGEDSVEMDTALVVLAPAVELGNLIKDAEETIADTKEALKGVETKMDDIEQRADTAIGAATTAAERANTAAEKAEKTNAAVETAEKERAAAEQERKTAEEQRKSQMQSNAEAEQARAGAEQHRVEAEKRRVSEETIRASAEDTRKTKEADRIAGETSREQQENSRMAAEQTRGSQEKQRKLAEVQRDDAEVKRVHAEERRAANEKTRENNEVDRAAAEDNRVTAETARTSAESKREKDTKEAIRNAQTATADAENVNAELNGNVLTVINRQGIAKSVNLTDADEHVTVNVTTTLASVSVEGIILNVYINNGADPQQYTTDSNGQAMFTATKGSTYKVVFPYIEGCAILNPVQHVAAVGNRIIDAVYTEETIKFEHVTVRMQKANDDDVLQPWEGAPVHVTIDGKKTDYITDTQGMVSFDVKIGTSYTVAVDKVDGMYEQYDNYSRTRKAMADSYRFNYAYHYYESGVWLIDDEGKKWTWDAWEASGKDKTHLVFVCIKTFDTQRYGGDIYISIDLLANFAQIPNKQWANQNVQFKNIPLDGTDNSDTQYYKFAYNGLVATITIIAEGDERGIETPFCDYCHSKTVDCAGEAWQGYGPTLEQWKLTWANIDYVVDAVNLKFPELGVSVNNYKGNKWTATQINATLSWYFGTQPNGKYKNGAILAFPFFACPSPSLSLSLSSEEGANEEGASVNTERVA